MGASHSRRRRGRARRRHDDEQQTPAERGWTELQQQAGNRGVNRLLSRREEGPADAAHPASILHRLGKGRALDPGVRSTMEGPLGAELDGVRIHTDPAAARLAGELDARAFTVGQHVAFAPGEFQPGTPAGDALLAHELAHVQQQAGATGVEAATEPHGAERDAGRAAVGAVAALWGNATGFARDLAGNARPRLRSGLALHRCSAKVEKRDPPSYLGPHSREALEDIRDIERRMDIVSALVMFGVTTGTAGPEGAAGEAVGVGVTGESTFLEGMPNAMLDVFVIKGSMILQRIDILRLDHDNDLNAEEKAFWTRVYTRVSELAGTAANRRRSR
jgi:hypothetical protein